MDRFKTSLDQYLTTPPEDKFDNVKYCYREYADRVVSKMKKIIKHLDWISKHWDACGRDRQEAKELINQIHRGFLKWYLPKNKRKS